MAERPSRVLMPAEVHRHPEGATERLAALLGTTPAVDDRFGASIVLPPGVDAAAAVEELAEPPSPSELRWRSMREAWASPPASAFLGRYYRERRRRRA